MFYVQYAHARVSSILRNAEELGLVSTSSTRGGAGGSESHGVSTRARWRSPGSTSEPSARPATRLGSTSDQSAITSLLTHEKEGELLRALAEFPRVVQGAATLREPHRVARYLEDTAAAYHRFYDSCRVLPMGDEEPNDLHRARLLLVDATRVVLANGLGLLGVSAPERM